MDFAHRRSDYQTTATLRNQGERHKQITDRQMSSEFRLNKGAGQVTPNGKSYASAISEFDLESELRELRQRDSKHVNAAEICCDRYADDKAAVALRYRNSLGVQSEWTFDSLKIHSERLARLLASLGIKKGDCIAGLLSRTPELLITALAAWRIGAIYQPLFTAFGPKAIDHRLIEAGTKAIVTSAEHRSKISGAAAIPVLTTSAPKGSDHDFWSEAVGLERDLSPASCTLDDPFLMMFTSGTTGLPKALHVPIRAIAAFKRYMLDGIGLSRDDVFWNMADPGWAYGLYYAVVGPLSLGFATTFFEGSFSVADTYQTIKSFGVTSLAGSPTAYRMMMGAGPEPAAAVRGQLRAISSAGEPLNPELVRWFAEHLNAPMRDHYGQTELGIVLCNHHGLTHPVAIGSAGYPLPGHHIAVLDDQMLERGVGEPGVLALDSARSPLMWFDGYLGRETSALVDGWYLTGDTCERNEDGSISFIGRSDDVITTSGYRVGPFDVESALLEHEAVLESAVVGKPDPQRTEIIKAFIVLNDGFEPDAELAEALKLHVKSRLSAHAYPREITFVDQIPKTPSGKVQRFLLRERD
ncbi:AMP-binding protein [Sphingobium sp. Cam5-1]|uniref:AMP-binding protein n=1 Tax=Sphingobium sp. Cam5-1 TaxID=2789327 RepID=UPI001E53CD57|nr:AMP-binding protein [Sphingobium sp. Cam5-1]